MIKNLGTNGGGFFNTNAAHPFENPTGFTNIFEILLVFSIPAALTATASRAANFFMTNWAVGNGGLGLRLASLRQRALLIQVVRSHPSETITSTHFAGK